MASPGDRLRSTLNSSQPSDFHLVYAATSGTLMMSVANLQRIAREAGQDEQRFTTLCAHEQIKDADVILAKLGKHMLYVLGRMELHPLPEDVVRRHVRFMAETLAPSHAEALTTFLHQRFFDGLQHRTTYHARELLDDLAQKGIPRTAPPAIVLHELPPRIRAALAFLRHTPAGVPPTVLAETLECPTDGVPTALAELITSRALALDDDRWRLLIRPPAIPANEERDVLERGLTALLRFIDAHSTTPDGRSLVLDAVRLTRACYQTNPKAIIRTFRLLETLLKRIGNKHLVLAANFWSAGAVAGITCDSVGSVVVHQAAGQFDIAVADPTQARGVMHIEIATSASSVIASDDGVSVDQISPTVRLSISVKNSAGKSFQVSLAQ
jgi:hypothetical protein